MYVREPAKIVTHIVSLGALCEVAYNIRRFYGPDAAEYPFDDVGSPLDWTTTVLETGDPNLLIPRSPDEARPRDHGLTFHGKWQTVENLAGGRDVFLGHTFDQFGGYHTDYVEPAREVFRARVERLYGLNQESNRIVFIRRRYPGDAEISHVWWPRLLRVLEEKFTLAQWSLAVVGKFVPGLECPEGAIPMDYRTARFDPVGTDWRGDIEWWDASLTRLDLIRLS